MNLREAIEAFRALDEGSMGFRRAIRVQNAHFKKTGEARPSGSLGAKHSETMRRSMDRASYRPDHGLSHIIKARKGLPT